MVLQALSCVVWVFSLLQGASAPRPQQSFRISGTVVDALGGQPLARAQVSISSRAMGDSTEVVTTGDDGRFAFENLAAGHYALSARRRGHIDQLYKQHESLATAIIVGPDLNTDNLRFELRPVASISGQVRDEMSEPVRNAQVMMLRQGLRSGRRQTWRNQEVNTDDQGHYRFSHLAPGTYFISVVAQPWYAQHVIQQRVQRFDQRSEQMVDAEITTGNAGLDVVYPITFYSNAADLSSASPITLHPGDAEIADLTLQPVPALHLVIRFSPSNESEQSWIQQATQHIAEGVEQGLPVQMQQIAPGVAEVTGLPPGKLNLGWVTSRGNESTTHSQTFQFTGDAEISPSDATASANVSGVIQMDDGSALSQPAYLRIHNPATGVSVDVQSDLNGEFMFKGQGIAAGTYGVTLFQPPDSAVRSMSATGGKVSGRTVEIGSAQDVRLTVVASKGSGTVTGFALKDRKPIDGVMIVLVPQDPEHNLVLFRRDQSDSDGSFNLGGILPGKYTVVAIENGWDLEWSSPSLLHKYLAGGEPLQINANAKLEVKVKVQQ